MKQLLLALTLIGSTAYAQTVPVPTPQIPNFCTSSQVRGTEAKVEEICLNKVSSFAQEHQVDCKLTASALHGCRAKCESAGKVFAKLKLVVSSNCRKGTASLKKAVIRYYK